MMKSHLLVIVLLAFSALFALAGCIEETHIDDQTGGNSGNLNSCKCSSEECTNCTVDTYTCQGSNIDHKTGVVGQYKGNNISNTKHNTIMCKKGQTCVQKSETEAECE